MTLELLNISLGSNGHSGQFQILISPILSNVAPLPSLNQVYVQLCLAIIGESVLRQLAREDVISHFSGAILFVT